MISRFFQLRICDWLRYSFGNEVLESRPERAARVLEEAAELAQAEGVDIAQADRILVRAYGRPAGEPSQEAAGVAITLLAWAAVADVDLERVARAEVNRIEGLPVEALRRKHAEKVTAGIALAGIQPLEGMPPVVKDYAVFVLPECPFVYCDDPSTCRPANGCRHRSAGVPA